MIVWTGNGIRIPRAIVNGLIEALSGASRPGKANLACLLHRQPTISREHVTKLSHFTTHSRAGLKVR